jgi:hypothetical protein
MPLGRQPGDRGGQALGQACMGLAKARLRKSSGQGPNDWLRPTQLVGPEDSRQDRGAEDQSRWCAPSSEVALNPPLQGRGASGLLQAPESLQPCWRQR